MAGDFDPIVPDWPAPAVVVARQTTRTGGFSQTPFDGFNLAGHVGDDPAAVAKNRRHLAERLEPRLTFQWLNQVHGVRVVEAADPSDTPTADAVFTRAAGVACVVQTADCLPVLLTDRLGTVVAAVHCGWRSLAHGVLAQTVSAMGVEGHDLLAWMGPAIGPCHFEVGEDVRSAFVVGRESSTSEVIDHAFKPGATTGKYLADLYRLAREHLHQLGVVAVHGGGWCTYCDQDRFFSYRRTARTGRMASLIYLKPT